MNAFGDSIAYIEQTHGEHKTTRPCEDARFEGAAIATTRREISDQSWERIARCTESYFWTTPVEHTELGGEDGWSTVIEGVRDGRYHVTYRWCLQCSGHARDAADAGLLECVRLIYDAVLGTESG